jgi:hypothetical protein
MDHDLFLDALALARCAIAVREELADCGLSPATAALIVRGAVLGEAVLAALQEEITQRTDDID